MVVEYSLRVLKDQERKLQDKLFEIEKGEYDRYSPEHVKKLKTDLVHKLRDLQFSIEVLESYDL